MEGSRRSDGLHLYLHEHRKDKLRIFISLSPRVPLVLVRRLSTRQSDSDVNSQRTHPSLSSVGLQSVNVMTSVSSKQPVIAKIKPQTAQGGSESRTTSKSLVSRSKNKTNCMFN